MEGDDLRTQGLVPPSSGGDYARLVVVDGGPSATCELSGEVLTIGRQSVNDLVLASDRVSRRHAQLRKVDGAWVVEDLGSFNGTLVNGRKVPADRGQTLHHKDLIQVCEFRLLFLAQLDVQSERFLSTIILDRDRVRDEADRVLREFLGQ